MHTVSALVAAVGLLAVVLARADRRDDWETRYLRAGVDPVLLRATA